MIVIGIAGPSGSGKSSFAASIAQAIDSRRIAVLSEDSYYKDVSHVPIADRNNFNFDHPSAFNHDLLVSHIQKLDQEENINVPIYDYATNKSSASSYQLKGPIEILILEGILLFAEDVLRSSMDIRIYMDTPLDICLLRRISRDLENRGATLEMAIKQYQATTRPMYFKFIEPSKNHADIIVPHGAQNLVAIDLIKNKLKSLLG